ncbi:nitroreductase [Rhizobium sp. BK529]|uniref:nitroreductase n=1 Tax=unclassified Rhizobium TaxID=2613769 RepID=UPI00104A5021|nr:MULTISPECIES: nitroreductase [unclassified Rhizobium]MBB3590616.1 nitroreductase [Rhizobium sp. BK529]TCS05309.1 nitroreductase [Rhizobium sp. BK418]
MSRDPANTILTVDRVMRGRFANRFFLDRSVELETVRQIIEVARHAGTGANVQPWHVHLVAGQVKASLIEALGHAHETEAHAHTPEYKYLPDDLPEPYASRRREFGAVFYGSLGIAPDDNAARARNTARNYRFFDAPVGLIFTIDRRLEKGSWLDLGMFIQNIMLAAGARGLDTCAQEFFSRYHAVIRRELSLSAEAMVVCGMSMGFGDPQWADRRPHMPKADVDDIASFHGF